MTADGSKSGDAAARRVAVIPGDGVGPEVIGEAKRILEVVARAANRKSN